MSEFLGAQVAPLTFRAGVTADFHKLRVVDVATGAEIRDVIIADSTTGELVRRNLDGQGNLQIVDGKIALIEETREIRLEWIDGDAAAPASPPPPTAAGDDETEHDA